MQLRTMSIPLRKILAWGILITFVFIVYIYAFFFAVQVVKTVQYVCDSPKLLLGACSAAWRDLRMPLHNQKPTMRRIFPISFSIPEELIVNRIPPKTMDSASYIPDEDKEKGYKFGPNDYEAYMASYGSAFFGYSQEKGGWDCMRHLEIMAAGSVPYIDGIENIPPFTMKLYPKELLEEFQRLPGVMLKKGQNDDGQDIPPHIELDRTVFDEEQYDDMLDELQTELRSHLTTVAMAKYVLRTMGRSHAKRVLMISSEVDTDYQQGKYQMNNYLRDQLVHGFRSLLGEGAIENHPIHYLYRTPECYNETSNTVLTKCRALQGFGFSYAFLLPPITVNRENLGERIRKGEFDVVLYLESTRTFPEWDPVDQQEALPQPYWDDLLVGGYLKPPYNRVAFIDGEDKYHTHNQVAHQQPDQLRQRQAFSCVGFYFHREMQL